eukprot:760867-Hanusia_phi.AAC.1
MSVCLEASDAYFLALSLCFSAPEVVTVLLQRRLIFEMLLPPRSPPSNDGKSYNYIHITEGKLNNMADRPAPKTRKKGDAGVRARERRAKHDQQRGTWSKSKHEGRMLARRTHALERAGRNIGWGGGRAAGREREEQGQQEG